MIRRHLFCLLQEGRLSWPWFVTPVVLGMLIQIFSTNVLAIEFIDESAARLPDASDTQLSQITYGSHWGNTDNDVGGGGEDPFMADFDLDGDIDIFQGVGAQN